MPEELITVHFTIELAESGHESLVFSRWLPIGKAEGLTFQHEGHSGVIWFELDSIGDLGEPDKDEIERTINNHVDKLYVEISVGVNVELATWIKKVDCSRRGLVDDESLSNAYIQLGVDVENAFHHGVSRFLSFIRIQKGQYWLPSSSRELITRAKARTSDTGWFRWCPTNVVEFTVEIDREDSPRLLRSSDWELAKAFMASNARPTLSLELLAGAEGFQKAGSNRAALTEAVSALDVTLALFARSSVQQLDLLPESVRSRVSIEGLPKLVEKFGLSGSVAILLPFLFSEDQLPKEILSNCVQAILERQNVVHNGQRVVSSTSLRRHLKALRQLCELLLSHSDAQD